MDFTPSVAQACEQDIPINTTLAQASVQWLESFLQFQTTLAYLKDPPSTYPLPPVDIMGGLASITSKITSGQYANEYDFEHDILELIFGAYDGHLAYIPFLPGTFSYSRADSLVSISADGIQLPKVYFLSEPTIFTICTGPANHELV